MKKFGTLVISLFALLALAACSSTRGTGVGAGGADGSGDAATYGYGSNGGSGSGVYGDDPAYGTRGTADRVIYFDYDSDRVRSDSMNVLQAHAQQLQRSGASVLLEGHTDERGSREYNMGLGERRARAVRQVMISMGVSPQQIRIISYGKERPAVSNYDERSFALNRRVEIAQ